MLTIKKRLSEKLASVMEAQFGNAPAAEELCAMLEYPPDNTMGDIALPCFKLSRTLRKAPPVIASSVGEALAADLPALALKGKADAAPGQHAGAGLGGGIAVF